MNQRCSTILDDPYSANRINFVPSIPFFENMRKNLQVKSRTRKRNNLPEFFRVEEKSILNLFCAVFIGTLLRFCRANEKSVPLYTLCAFPSSYSLQRITWNSFKEISGGTKEQMTSESVLIAVWMMRNHVLLEEQRQQKIYSPDIDDTLIALSRKSLSYRG